MRTWVNVRGLDSGDVICIPVGEEHSDYKLGVNRGVCS